jgi:hypothetical protein
MSPATKTKPRSELELATEALAEGRAALDAAEQEYAEHDRQIAAGTPPSVDEYADVTRRVQFYRKAADGLEQRAAKAEEASRIERARALLEEVRTNTPDSASRVVEAWQEARDALSTLIAKTEEFNSSRASYISRTDEFKSPDGQPPKALRDVLSQVAIRCEMFSPVALSAEVLVQCTERRLRTEEDRIAAQALRAIKPAPHYTLQLVQGMAGKRAKGSGQPVTDEQKASYIEKREAGASPAEAAKTIGRDA